MIFKNEFKMNLPNLVRDADIGDKLAVVSDTVVLRARESLVVAMDHAAHVHYVDGVPRDRVADGVSDGPGVVAGVYRDDVLSARCS